MSLPLADSKKKGGYFLKRQFFTVITTLCLALLLCLSAVASTDMSDTSGHWAEVHIKRWINDGLITGYPDGQFKPDNSITRAEMAALVNRAFDIPKNDSRNIFSDVKPSDWFYDDVLSGQAAGYISGYTDGTFKPNKPITRQEAASLIMKLLNLEPGNANAINAFIDKQSIDEWAKPGVNAVITHGLMGGFPDKTFGPRKNITRAETVVTLDKALSYKPEKVSGVNGIVKLDNQPVKGATVRIFVKGSHESLKDTISGQDGTFAFTVPDGQYEVTAIQDKHAGYAGPVTVTNGSAAGIQEVLLTTGAQVTGKLVDKSGKALSNTPFYFTTNPTFGGKTDNNGQFSIVLPMRGPNGQLLSYTGFFFHNGARQDFATGQQFNGDTNLDQMNTNVPGQTPTGGGGGGGSPSDTMPPTWDANYPKTADVTTTGFKLLAKTNESGKAYYVVLADGAAAPSVANVKSGTGAIKHGQITLQANTEAGIIITGLTAGTAYDIYVVAEDAVPNLQAAVMKLDVTTLTAPDNTAPTISATSASGVTHNSATLNFTSDESGTYYYLVYDAADPAPDAATIKAQGAAVAKGTDTAVVGANTANVTGLSASTAYKAYIIVVDASGNASAVATIVFNTVAAPDTTPPTLSATGASDVTHNSATLQFTSDEAGTYYYLVYDAADPAPDAATIKAQGAAAAKGTDTAVVGANTANVTGLSASTAYKAYVIVVDAANNASAVAPIDINTTAAPDTTAPVLSGATASDVNHNSATLIFTSDEAGTCYYLVYDAADPAPDAATIKAQGDAVAKGTAAALAGDNTANVAGLSPSTAYNAYVIVEDAAGNASAVATIDINTDAAPPDTTPPVWVKNPEISSTTQNGIVFLLQANEDSIAYWVVLVQGAPAPSVAEVKNNTGSGGSPAVAFGLQGLAANAETFVTASGLDPSTSYDIYVVAEDSSGNLQTSTFKLEATTQPPGPDNTPPSWTVGYPKTSAITQNGFDLLFNADENGTAYYVVLTDGATTPTADEVKAGKGSGGSAAEAFGSQALVANTETSTTISGLTAATPYDIYVVAEDTSGNLQGGAIMLDVTTASPANPPPVWAQSYPTATAITESGLDLLLKANKAGMAYCVALNHGAAKPSSLQVKAGADSSGNAAKSGQKQLQANVQAAMSITDLSPGTTYDLYVVAEDNDSNLQANPTLIVRTTLVPDTTPPALKYAAVNGSDLELIFNEKFDPSSQPASDDFSVSSGSAYTISNLALSGAKVNITLAETVRSEDTVTVSYTPGVNPLRDEAGNNLPSFANRPVVNNTAVLVAPPADSTVATSLFASTSFLYTGDNPLQSGVNPDTIVENRVAVLRGQVFTKDSIPLPGVTITIVDHPEFGSTMSRADGWFDMAVNGGGPLAVRYEKTGFITAQRQINVPWQDFTFLPDVVLIPHDTKTTSVTLNANQMQVAQGSPITDEDGTRQATLIIPAGVTAQTGNGTPINNLTIRATEYTVGENGPQAMPAELPPNVGYTYCVEYSADEAENVTFSQPIFHYVENFIGAPVGGIVPMGYYDYDKAAWIPSQNGRVIKILGINSGMADLDLDGSGVAADAAALAALGVTDDERRQLAALYGEGQELWRVPITHFTPWDCNWPYGPPIDADRPNLPQPRGNNENRPCYGSGSIIEYQNQVLGEMSKIWGTSYTLNYRSSRVEGNKSVRSLTIPISTSDIHEDLKRIELEIYLAGRVFTKTFPAEKNLSYVFTWDGKDAYGRLTQGSTPVYLRVRYVYPAIYLNPSPLDYSFSQSGRSPEGWESDRDNLEAIIVQEWQGSVSYWDSSAVGLGGWTLNVHHSFDPFNQALELGDGSRRELGDNIIIGTIAGLGGKDNYGFDGDGGPASESRLRDPNGVAMAPDGSLYIADSTNNRIRRVDPDGIITTVAGSYYQGDFSGDGGPATEARLNSPNDVAVGPDGSLYISDYYNNRIRRVDPNGIITTVAGNGGTGDSGDGGLATNAEVGGPRGIAVGPDGSLYISHSNRIRRVNPAGIITTVAGNGTIGIGGDGGPAVDAQLNYPCGVDIAPDGVIYIADTDNHRIRRVGLDGIITTIAGSYEGYGGDGGPATSARLKNPGDVAVGPDGSIYVADRENQRIRQIYPTGTITTIAGNGTEGFSGDNGSPVTAQLFYPSGLAVGQDGSIYIADSTNHCIRRVGQPLLGNLSSNWVVPSEDGSELYLFDTFGRHQSTVNSLTGSTVYEFIYDEQGRLKEVKDAFGNITEIQRDGEGNPTAIVAPGGQTTYLALNESGYLTSIKCPLLKETTLEYTSDGLLTKLTDHKGNIHNFIYDESGRLVRDEDPAGGYTELLRSELDNYSGYKVEVKTAEGLHSTYQVDYLPEGGTRRVDTDPLGGVTTTETLADGSSKVTYPDGTIITQVQGPDPRPTINMLVPVTKEFTVTTPGGLTSRLTRERAVTMDDPVDLLSVTRILDKVTNNGNIYTTTYDIDRNTQTVTVTSTTPEGRQMVNILDWYGRLIEERNGNLIPVKYTYDDTGHIEKVEQGDQFITYTWDEMNRITALEDASGKQFQYEYNGADLLTKLTMPGDQFYIFGYDANGNVTEITMPNGAKHQLGYTKVDLPESYTPPGNGSYQKSYNLDRAVDYLTLPSSRLVDYQYDAAGRVIGMQYDPISSSFGYSDNTDRVTTISRDPDGVNYSFMYDGSLLTQMAVSGQVYGVYNYGYNNDFKLNGFTLTGAPQIALEYDADGLVTKYGEFTLARNHSFGLPTQISNGVMTIDYSYDNFGRITNRTHQVNGQQIYSLDLSFDNTGLISERNETVAGSVYGSTTSYQLFYDYDANKQLTGVTGSRLEAYFYDDNGNRSAAYDANGNLVPAHYDDQDRLVFLGEVDYRFNEDGFLSWRDNDFFEYSAQGELLQATLGSGTRISYLYDGVGRRVARLVDGVATEYYLYGNPGNPFEVTAVKDSNGVVSHYYYDQINCLFAIKQGSDWYYVASDQQGTPRVVSDATGQVVKVMEYNSFGKLLSDSNPDFKLPIGFAGGISDPDTGLVHFGMRDYDPATGRWTARDPILFNGQQGNLYVYVSNNPVNLRDPSGLFCIGGSYYAGVGIGGQLCITGEGVSLCGEVGFGVGGGVEISPFGGLADTGTKVGAQAEATYMGVGPSVGLTLDNCGSLKFEGALKAGPFSQSASYDFLEGKWDLGDLSVGGEKANMNDSWLESFKPKVSASAKLFGQGCVRF
jgi:RHS repeat-associated protein